MSQKPGSESGQREVVLRLQPESLGELRVQVGLDGESVTARFEATTAEARDLLHASLATLRSSLEARGLHVEKLHVQLASPLPLAADQSAGRTVLPGRVGERRSSPAPRGTLGTRSAVAAETRRPTAADTADRPGETRTSWRRRCGASGRAERSVSPEARSGRPPGKRRWGGQGAGRSRCVGACRDRGRGPARWTVDRRGAAGPRIDTVA